MKNLTITEILCILIIGKKYKITSSNIQHLIMASVALNMECKGSLKIELVGKIFQEYQVTLINDESNISWEVLVQNYIKNAKKKVTLDNLCADATINLTIVKDTGKTSILKDLQTHLNEAGYIYDEKTVNEEILFKVQDYVRNIIFNKTNYTEEELILLSIMFVLNILKDVFTNYEKNKLKEVVKIIKASDIHKKVLSVNEAFYSMAIID